MHVDKVALVIGINDYQLAPLSFCINDAQEVAEALEMTEFGFHTTVLLDNNATRKGILNEIGSARLKKPSLFLLYFSGHGCTTDIGSYLVTHDAAPLDEGIELQLLGRLIDQMAQEGTTTIVILDCCHSGVASPWPSKHALRINNVENSFTTLALSRIVLAACRPEQYSYEDSCCRHGLFTYYLLEGLLGNAADHDGVISVNSIFDYICQPFENHTKQTPVFRGDIAGRVILARGFPPRLGKPIEKALLQRLESEGRQYLDDYAARTAVSHNIWKESGYSAACQALEPILRWFNTNFEKYPDLKRHVSFCALYDSAKSRLAQLGQVDEGTTICSGSMTERIGDGAFGSVWKVKKISGEHLAYKIYHPHELRLGEKLNRFERGYRAMKQLDHPRIVHVREFTECPVGFFMDYIDGPNLRNLAGGIEDPVQILEILLEVAETLRHAHGRGVIHRDIKPENIVVCYDAAKTRWIPYLTDFDLAWFSTATQITKEAIGTIYYAAPEQLANPGSKSAHDKTVDVFSFGQLLYFIITGTNPIPLGMADNLRALRDSLGKWSSEKAARQMVELYSSCSEQKPEKRHQQFDIIADQISVAFNDLRGISLKNSLSTEELIREIVFSLVGLETKKTSGLGASFRSLSNRTIMSILTSYQQGAVVDIEANFALQSLEIPGMSYYEARKTLSAKIETFLHSNFPKVKCKAGNQTNFEINVIVPQVPLTITGVAQCRQIFSRVIDLMERI